MSLVAHLGASLGVSGGTTGNIDTTGATLLVVCAISFNASSTPTIADSNSNTWTQINQVNDGTAVLGTMWYVNSATPTVGAGHNFTLQGTSTFIAVMVLAFNNSQTNPLVHNNSNSSATSVTTLNTGSVAAVQNNEVKVSFLGVNALTSGTSIDSGFTLQDTVAYSAGNNFGSSSAYRIDSSLTSGSASFSWTTGTDAVALVANFKATGAAATVSQNIVEIQQAVTNAAYY
jgi:hypothetical protein